MGSLDPYSNGMKQNNLKYYFFKILLVQFIFFNAYILNYLSPICYDSRKCLLFLMSNYGIFISSFFVSASYIMIYSFLKFRKSWVEPYRDEALAKILLDFPRFHRVQNFHIASRCT